MRTQWGEVGPRGLPGTVYQPYPCVAYWRRKTTARLRLFCFPFAGGGASVFREWSDALGPDIEVCPVQLPGRESRLLEEPHYTMQNLVRSLARDLGSLLERPFAFFGHSMGALVAFELALQIRRTSGQEPVAFLASGSRGPVLPSSSAIHDLSDDAFLAALRELDGTPREVLEEPQLMELLLPMMRADFRVNETYVHRRAERLSCPVEVFGGRTDAETTAQELQAWQASSTGPIRMTMFDGGHFFMRVRRPELLAAVRESLDATLYGGQFERALG